MQLFGETDGTLEAFWDNGHVVEVHLRVGDATLTSLRLGPAEILALRDWLVLTTTEDRMDAEEVEMQYKASTGRDD